MENYEVAFDNLKMAQQLIKSAVVILALDEKQEMFSEKKQGVLESLEKQLNDIVVFMHE